MNFITWKIFICKNDKEIKEFHLVTKVVFKHMNRVFSRLKKNSRDVEGLLGSRLWEIKVLFHELVSTLPLFKRVILKGPANK